MKVNQIQVAEEFGSHIVNEDGSFTYWHMFVNRLRNEKYFVSLSIGEDVRTADERDTVDEAVEAGTLLMAGWLARNGFEKSLELARSTVKQVRNG